jgi:hypothetical protein
MTVAISGAGNFIHHEPIIKGGAPRRVAQGNSRPSAIAVAVTSIHLPLTADERAICAKMHVSEAEYVKSKARRRRGGNPLEGSALGQKVVGSGSMGTPSGRGFRETT